MGKRECQCAQDEHQSVLPWDQGPLSMPVWHLRVEWWTSPATYLRLPWASSSSFCSRAFFSSSSNSRRLVVRSSCWASHLMSFATTTAVCRSAWKRCHSSVSSYGEGKKQWGSLRLARRARQGGSICQGPEAGRGASSGPHPPFA